MLRFQLCAVLALCAAQARAEDWPGFRGPTQQGLASGTLPTSWSKSENIAWKQAIPGSGWSSPILAGGRIYLTTAVPSKDKEETVSLRVLCLDAATGARKWDRAIFELPAAGLPRIHAKNTQASPTPILQGNRLFVHFGHLGTAALDLDGKVLWKKDLKYSPVHGNGGSPILVGSNLVFSVDGADQQYLVALDQKTGSIAWKTERHAEANNKFTFSTPLLIEVGGKPQIISQCSGAVAAFDPADGKEIWRVRFGQGYSVVPCPVFGHGLLYVCTGFNTPNLLAIRPDGQGDVTNTHVAWKMTKHAPLTPSPVLVGKELYVVSDKGVASCLDAVSGKVHWEERLEGAFSASPLAAGGKVYFQNEAGVGFVVRASTVYELLSRNDLGEKTLASYAAAEGALFVRTATQLYRIQGERGAPAP